jgi:hypothetical protein
LREEAESLGSIINSPAVASGLQTPLSVKNVSTRSRTCGSGVIQEGSVHHSMAFSGKLEKHICHHILTKAATLLHNATKIFTTFTKILLDPYKNFTALLRLTR